MTALLTLENLSVARGGLPVLSGVRFQLMPGDALVLRGPNGSGKTTLLRTIAGLQPASGGEILAEPDSVAYAAHADGLKGTLSVAENLSFWAALFGVRDLSPALAAFGLEPLRNRRVQALSAGQKRRVGLARMVLTGRPIWIFDEPTVSLDVDAVAAFAEMVRLHLAGGGAALLATHIDLGLDAKVLDVAQFKARAIELGAQDEAFL